uniref:Uncharacterized protein n=1 Tax=Arcella intermedia TaxID=1963864 RepID=A0A6B2LLB5_9EUKA
MTKWPNISNTVLAGFISGTGDVAAQLIEISEDPTTPIYWTRTIYVTGFGLLTGAPSIQWFRLLDRWATASAAPSAVLRKVLLNQLIFSPAMTASFFIYINACQHAYSGWPRVREEAARTLRNEFLPSMVASSFYWPVVQALNFTLVPIHLRAVWNSFFAAGWNCFVSYRGHR